MRWQAHNPENWHRWFAWYPVTISGQKVWLEVVERQCGESIGGDYTHYRAVATVDSSGE